MKRNQAYNRLVIKVGTNVLSTDDGLLDEDSLTNLVQQITKLKTSGIEIILISSGAVGAGRGIFKPQRNLSRVKRRQLLASIGQPILLNRYLDLFRAAGLHVAQILATKEDFRDRHHYLNMRNCFEALMTENVVPIVNENDVIAIDELMFTDNDELAALVASMIDADAMIVLTNVDGVYDGDPRRGEARLIREVQVQDDAQNVKFSQQKSSFGRGGMHTKFRVSKKLAKTGIHVHISNGRKERVILDIVNGNLHGTHFVGQKNVSPLKKWIAYQEENGRASVVVNAGAKEALQDPSFARSLLPIGISEIQGEFSKGDVIKLLDEKGQLLALGLAQYNAETAKKYMGQKGHKALVHYDYLYLTEEND
ncbi:MAG: glutamate 5-kinase [Saprospiraceae bacterium]|nr:glutamate 5-kinase [Saprospiraceae bacterium]